MSTREMIRALYEYNEWANNHVLEAASALSEEEMGRDMGASFASVQGNLMHIVGAQGHWLGRWMGSEREGEWPWVGKGETLEALGQSYAASHDELRSFVSSLTEADLTRLVCYQGRRGDLFEIPLWQFMMQVANHGTHHRAETAMVLAALGKPIRQQLDYLVFELKRAQGQRAG